MTDHRGTSTVERLIRTLRERSGACRAAAGSFFNFAHTLIAILRDLRVSTHRVSGSTPCSLFFGCSPNIVLSNLGKLCSRLDNRRILRRRTAFSMNQPELQCLYDVSNTEDTEPPMPVFSRPRGANRPRVCTRPAERAVAPSRATPSVPHRPKHTPSFVNITNLIVSETPHIVTLLSGRVYCKRYVGFCFGNPRPGTFGTSARLGYGRVFVNP